MWLDARSPKTGEWLRYAAIDFRIARGDRKAKPPAASLSRGETRDAVHGSFINLMKIPTDETLIFRYQHRTISCFDAVLRRKAVFYDE